MSSDRANAALDTHKSAVFALIDASGAVIAAVRLNCTPKQVIGDAVGRKRIAERNYLESPDIAAKSVDIGDTGNGAQRRADHPIEQAAALGEGEIRTVDGEHEHLAKRARDRSQPAVTPSGRSRAMLDRRSDT